MAGTGVRGSDVGVADWDNDQDDVKKDVSRIFSFGVARRDDSITFSLCMSSVDDNGLTA